MNKTSSGNCLAKAMYDNVAEAPDELAFRKGDILTVLEQNTNCMEGWWLCSLRGRQGIVPGNRLRLLPGMYDPSGLGNVGGIQEDNRALRRSWISNPTKVITPQKVGAVYLYDVPSSSRSPERGNTPRSVLSRYQGSDLGGSYDSPPSPRSVHMSSTYDEPKSHPVCNSPLPPTATYDLPKSNALVPDVGLHDYDTPSDSNNAYDVPRSAEKEITSSHIITISDNYDAPPSLNKSSPPIYDGRAFSRSSGDTSTSSSFRSPSGSHSSMETLSLSSVGGSNRSSLEQHPNELYDIPPEPQPVLDPKTGGLKVVPYQSGASSQETYDVPSNNSLAQFNKPMEGAYDVPPQAMRDSSPLPRTDVVDSVIMKSAPSVEVGDYRGVLPESTALPLELSSAVEMLVKYHHEVQGAMSKLFGFVSTTWRSAEDMEAKIEDIESACHKILSALLDFLNFAQGALANSIHADDKTLNTKLCKLVKPLRDSCAVVKKCVQSLDDKSWTVKNLAQATDNNFQPDELDQLVVCARGLVEDVRQIASFIQGNSALLFKSHPKVLESANHKATQKPAIAPKPELKPKPATPLKLGQKLQERPLPPTPAGLIKTRITSKESSEYDYVNLESKETVEKENEAIKANLPKDMCQSFDKLVVQSEIPVSNHDDEPNGKVISDPRIPLDNKDVQLLQFYGEQIDIHILHLTNAIDAFLLTIKNNQPPKVFVGHSKFIIISSHKLVFIGDTVHRNIINNELKSCVLQNSNSLCDSLKSLVSSTKKAALEFPSVAAVQEMVDSVVDVSHLANNLKVSILKPVQA